MATTVTRTSGNGVPEGTVTPEEAAAIRSSVAGKEVAPSSRQQSMLFDNWRDAADRLGSPFEVERIPISKLRAMRRDPMLGFGLSFIKIPHVRARWYVNAKDTKGPNAQIAAHLDHDLRLIWTTYTLQFLNAIDFGFQAMAKRFELRTPTGTYIETNPDTGEQEEKPIWSQGNVQPIAWKPFVALPPEVVEPNWNPDGSFNGFNVKPSGGSGSGSSSGSGGSGGNNKDQSYDIDVYHALWATNEKDANFGSIFGYPRLGYAYRYWWSYWFRWAIADRAFEKKADPSIIVRHPEGQFTNPDTGETMDYGDYALLMGERMRSGGVIALPSDVYEDANGRGTTPQWDIGFTKDATDFEPFDKSFDYIDVQKLRSLFIPEQAFLEGKGGTSSRNVAAELGSSFTESQAVLSAQHVEHVNRYMIPQWLAVNYPEFIAAGGMAEVIMQGFADEDVEFTNQVIQLIGQQEAGASEISKLVDLKQLLENRGTPIASFAEQVRRKAEQDALAQQQAPLTTPTPGSVGVVPNAQGFSTYINPREVIYLSETGTGFIDKLPSTVHYEDTAIKGFSRRLWNVYRDLYRDEFSVLIGEIESGADPIEFSDSEDVELADWVERAKEIIRPATASKLWPQALQLSENLMGKIMRRASRVEKARSRMRGPAVDQQRFDDWLSNHLPSVAAKVAETSRQEIGIFLANQLREGVTDRKELAKAARAHFDDFPEWKTDRLVRTEVRDVYNAATLILADTVGAQVQATDAMGADSDPDCIERDGKIFSVGDAMKEEEHPNGTLGWKVIPVKLSIEYGAELEEDQQANFDPDASLIQFSDEITPARQREYLKAIVDHVIAQQEDTEDGVVLHGLRDE